MSEEAVVKGLPPHDKLAEQTVIGSMLFKNELIIKAYSKLKPSDFFERKYSILFQIITELNEEGKSADVVTVNDRARFIKGAENIVSPSVIMETIRSVATTIDFDESVRIVYEKSMLRKLIKTSEEILKACYLDDKELDEIMENAEKRIYDLVQKRGDSESLTISQVMMKVVEQVEAASKTTGNVTGISTGFLDLDFKTAGLQKTDLILVAARPSMGKTAFALNIAEYVAIKQNIPTVVFSLEMAAEALGKRILSMNSRVEATKLRDGNLSDTEWEKLIESVKIVGSSNLIIDGRPGMTVGEVRSKCRKLKSEKNIGLVMIDYLQLLTTGKKSESMQLEVSEISRSLKAIAREIDAPVIALSQLSRAVEKRDDKRPMLSDLRDSGAIEQDADVVMFLYRDDYYHKDSEDAGITEVIIGKQRNGPVGTIKLGWHANFTKFVNLEKRELR